MEPDSLCKQMLTSSGAEIEQKYFPSLLQLFFNTYAYYHDRNSRRAVERCIRAIFSSNANPEALAAFVTAVHRETLKPGIAPSNAFVLVEWCSILLQELSGTSHWEKWGLETLISNAQALALCLSESSRSNVKHSALVVTRRGLRKVFSRGETRKRIIEEAVEKLASKGSQPSASNAIMLGVIAGVCARKPEANKILLGKKDEYYAFYTREIIGSRTPVPPHVANGLEDFFVAFTTKEDVEKEIVPSLEKSLLRAPEIVLNDLLTPLFKSFNDSIDLSTILRNNLLKPFLSNTKSTNVTIRNGALSAFKAAILKCHESEIVAQISEDILVPLKSGKLPSADQRAIHAQMLGALPISRSIAGTSAHYIAAIAAKEANETALSAETLALLHYLEWGVRNGVEIEKFVIDAIVKGLSDKKISPKRLWTIRLGELLWSIDDAEILKFGFSTLSESVMPALLETWNELTANPVAAAQSGLITTAYVFAAISMSKLAISSSSKVEAGLQKAQIARHALTMDPKPSFLLNPRIYGKLSNNDDFMWFIRALSSLAHDIAIIEPKSAISVGWSQAFIFCICSSSVKPTLRRYACHTLSQLYVQNPAHISNIIVSGLWRWRQSVEANEKDSAAGAAKTDNQNLHLVVKSICLPPADIKQFGKDVSDSVREEQMISMLILARPELLPRLNWIDLCLRVAVDPGNLARASGDLLIQQILDCTNFDEKVVAHY